MTDPDSRFFSAQHGLADLSATRGRGPIRSELAIPGGSARPCNGLWRAWPPFVLTPAILSLVFALALCPGAIVARADDPQPATKKAVAEKPQPDKPAADKPADKPVAAEDAKKAAEKKKVENRKLQRKLQARTDLKADNLPLKDVVKQLAELHDIAIRLDEAALKKLGVAPDKPITVSVENFTLALALKHILKDLNLHYGVVNGEIVIGDPPPPPEPEERPAPEAVVAEAVIMEAMPAMMPGAVGGDAQVQQFTRQHKALLKAEMHLVRAVCKPTDEQLQKINEDLEQSLKNKLGLNDQNQKKVVRQRAGQVLAGDPLQLSRAWVHKAVAAHLTAEQVALYQEQVDQRAADRRNASIHNVVARLDQDLALSAAQRDQITENLRDNWNDGWCPSPNQFIQMEQWFPKIPEKYILDLLGPEQKAIWKLNRNQNSGVVFAQAQFAGFMGGMFGEEFLWQDEEEAAGPKADAAPNARLAE